MIEATGFITERLVDRLTRLGEFVPIFEAPGFKFAEVRGGNEIEPGVFEMPWSELSDAATRFYELCYADGWVLSQFDWPQWGGTPEAVGLLKDPGNPSPGVNLMKADTEQLAKLLTGVIRYDRFCEGYLQSAFKSGLLLGIVRRARELGSQNEGVVHR